MSSGCGGCFNGCHEIISDQCVKYTGNDVPELDIEKGIPLSELEEKIIDFLLTVLDGTGIFPIIPAEHICTLVQSYLPINPNLNDILTAVTQAVCNLQEQIDDIVDDIEIIEADYTIPSCLSGDVVGTAGTHAVLQAALVKLCAINSAVIVIQNSLSQYVKIIDIDNIIEQYLEDHIINQQYAKMVPYTVVEYYGPLSGYPTVSDGFTAAGVGYGAWEKVFLCDGRNGTPDKRGRTPVGAHSMSSANYVNTPETDPSVPGNPNYSIRDTAGENYTILTTDQLPPHKHAVPDPQIIDPGHRHVFACDRTIVSEMGFDTYNDVAGAHNIDLEKSDYGVIPAFTKSDGNQVGIEYQVTHVTSTIGDTENTGRRFSHDNRLPVIACYYLMYIP